MEENTTVEETAPVEETEEPQVEESAPQDEVEEETSEESTASDEEERKPSRAEKRINDLTRARREAEREREYWKQQALAQQKGPQPAQEVTQKPEPVTTAPIPPQELDFDDNESYQKALHDYQRKHAAFVEYTYEQRKEREVAESRKQAEQRAREQQNQTLAEKFESGFDRYEDFGDIVFSEDMICTEYMKEGLTYADNAAEIAYLLGTDKKKAYSIAQMAPAQQIIEIAKLDSKVGSTAKKTTKAPSPIAPVTPSGDRATAPDPSKNYKEWARLRNEGKI